MQRFCANISMLYQETDFLQRYQWAAEDGFSHVECLFPYAYQARVIKTAADQAGVTQHLFNTYPGAWQQGDRGLACHTDKVAAFRDSIHQALDYAHTLHTSLLHVMAGVCPTLDLGCEYHPKTTTRAGLGWLSQALNEWVTDDKANGYQVSDYQVSDYD